MGDATQPSTQPYTDPRREGLNNSGLNDQDVSDILCILHPSSPHAYAAVAATAKRNSQHILQKDELEYDSLGPASTQSSDIALRMSSTVKDPLLGFSFGRNSSKSDIILVQDDREKRVSNVHFRIYMKEDGILMLQDTSTNGTFVNDNIVKKDQKDGAPATQMLVNGSIIFVPIRVPHMGAKFIVRFPSRDGYQAEYMRNIHRYFDRIRQETGTVAGPTGKMNGHQLSLFSQEPCHTHGMHWNGGHLYNVTGQVGKGAFATVYKLATKNDGAVYACKEIDTRRLIKNNTTDQKVDNEMRIMSNLNHVSKLSFIFLDEN